MRAIGKPIVLIGVMAAAALAVGACDRPRERVIEKDTTVIQHDAPAPAPAPARDDFDHRDDHMGPPPGDHRDDHMGPAGPEPHDGHVGPPPEQRDNRP